MGNHHRNNEFSDSPIKNDDFSIAMWLFTWGKPWRDLNHRILAIPTGLLEERQRRAGACEARHGQRASQKGEVLTGLTSFDQFWPVLTSFDQFWPMVNEELDPENHPFLMETHLPTLRTARVQLSFTDGEIPKVSQTAMHLLLYRLLDFKRVQALQTRNGSAGEWAAAVCTVESLWTMWPIDPCSMSDINAVAILMGITPDSLTDDALPVQATPNTGMVKPARWQGGAKYKKKHATHGGSKHSKGDFVSKLTQVLTSAWTVSESNMAFLVT